MARTLGRTRDGRTIWLVFFDGKNSPKNASHGSRLFRTQLELSGEFPSVDAVLNVSRIGDCYLSLSRDERAPRWMTEILWNTADRQGYATHFGPFAEDLVSDLSPFRDVGIPTFELADFNYG